MSATWTAAVVGGSVMIALIWLLRTLALRRLPKWLFRLLWLMAALRLLLPFSLTIELETELVLPEPAAVRELQTVTVDRIGAVVSDTTAASISPELIAAIVYFFGVVVTGGFFLHAYARLYRTAHRADVVYVRGMTVRAGGGFDSPFSCGLLRPVIFLPESMLTLDAGQLDFILAHERRHIKSGDQLAKWLFAAAVCLHWYNPLAWVMFTLAGRDIELACDEAVASRLGDPAAYALCLITAEEIRSIAPVNTFGAPAISERIECIMKTKKRTICGFIVAGLVLALMTVFFISVTAAAPAGRELATTLKASLAEEQIKAAALAADLGEEQAKLAALEAALQEKLAEEAALRAELDEELDDEKNAAYQAALGQKEQELAALRAGIAEQKNRIDAIQGMLRSQDQREAAIMAEIDAQTAETSVVVSEDPPVVTVELVKPLAVEYKITQGYSISHPGVDLAAAEGSEIYAVADGVVTVAQYDWQDGYTVTVRHADDMYTIYSHCKELLCAEGDEVVGGQVIATVGKTGAATGAFLGFEMICDGECVIPTELFGDELDNAPVRPF